MRSPMCGLWLPLLWEEPWEEPLEQPGLPRSKEEHQGQGSIKRHHGARHGCSLVCQPGLCSDPPRLMALRRPPSLQARGMCPSWHYERSIKGPANIYQAQLARRTRRR